MIKEFKQYETKAIVLPHNVFMLMFNDCFYHARGNNVDFKAIAEYLGVEKVTAIISDAKGVVIAYKEKEESESNPESEPKIDTFEDVLDYIFGNATKPTKEEKRHPVEEDPEHGFKSFEEFLDFIFNNTVEDDKKETKKESTSETTADAASETPHKDKDKDEETDSFSLENLLSFLLKLDKEVEEEIRKEKLEDKKVEEEPKNKPEPLKCSSGCNSCGKIHKESNQCVCEKKSDVKPEEKKINHPKVRIVIKKPKTHPVNELLNCIFGGWDW